MTEQEFTDPLTSFAEMGVETAETVPDDNCQPQIKSLSLDGRNLKIDCDLSRPYLDGLEVNPDGDAATLPVSSLDSPLSPSIGSLSSSVLGTLRLDDEQDSFLETKDLVTKVNNPEKHVTTMETFITFCVTTNTTRVQFDDSEYMVRRRYNDFLWLRQKLVDDHPTHLVPPLPEKHSLRGQLDRYDREFVLQRMTLLNKFLSRVAEHPTLSFNESFMVFLTAKPPKWNCHKKAGSSMFGRVSSGFQNLASSYMVRERPQEFKQHHLYVHKLAELLGSVERVSSRIHRERVEYVNELQALYPVFGLWSSSEPELSLTLSSVSKAFEISSQANKEAIGEHTQKWALPLKEYQLYVEAVKESLIRRDGFQIQHELTVDELNRKRRELDEFGRSEASGLSFGTFFGKSKEEVSADKQAKLDANVKDLITQAGTSGDRNEVANSDLRADMDRWVQAKNHELRSLLCDMADRNVNLYEKCLSAWEEAFIKLKNEHEATNGSF